MTATVVLLALFVGTYVLKAVGPLLLGGRDLPPALSRLTTLLPAAMLAALVLTSTFTDTGELVADVRVGGLLAAAVALSLRAPFVVVIVVAATVTAGLRAWGL